MSIRPRQPRPCPSTSPRLLRPQSLILPPAAATPIPHPAILYRFPLLSSWASAPHVPAWTAAAATPAGMAGAPKRTQQFPPPEVLKTLATHGCGRRYGVRRVKPQRTGQEAHVYKRTRLAVAQLSHSCRGGHAPGHGHSASGFSPYLIAACPRCRQ